MEDFLKMDIFFVITSAVVLLLGICAIVALIYIIRILRNVDHISAQVSEETDNIKQDIAGLRKNIAAEGMRWKHMSDFFGTIIGRSTRRRAKQDRDNE